MDLKGFLPLDAIHWHIRVAAALLLRNSKALRTPGTDLKLSAIQQKKTSCGTMNNTHDPTPMHPQGHVRWPSNYGKFCEEKLFGGFYSRNLGGSDRKDFKLYVSVEKEHSAEIQEHFISIGLSSILPRFEKLKMHAPCHDDIHFSCRFRNGPH